MITYRTVKTELDVRKVERYCNDNKILNPCFFPVSTVFIACNEEDEIVGLCGVRAVVQIEPLVSNNPVMAHILTEKAMTAASMIGKEVIAVTKSENEKWIAQIESYGFTVTDKNMTMLRRDV